MTQKTFALALAILLVCTQFSISAQKAPIKFGKVSIDDLQMTTYESDTSAHAVVLCDYGVANFEYNTASSGFFIEFVRHQRIKILDKTGFNFADISIPFYEGNNDREKISSIKAVTYNLEGGKIAETNIDKKDIYEEETSEYWRAKRFSMPAIKEGSIIEIKYTKSSPYVWNLQPWLFQQTVPIKWSEYRVGFPEWFQFKKDIKGYDFGYIKVNDEERSSGTISFPGRGVVTYAMDTYRWVAENMPAFEEEDYTTSYSNYLTRIEFELASIQYPNSPIERFLKSWEKVAETYLQSERSGKLIKKSGFLKNEITVMVKEAGGGQAGIIAIFEHVRKEMKWNRSTRHFASYSSLKKIYEEKGGSSADLNLLLVGLLQIGGYDAHPVVLSTREHGLLNPFFPGTSQFNYVIAAVNTADGQLLLDATDRKLPANILPPRCINDRGLLMKEGSVEWVDFTPKAKDRFAVSGKLSLNENMQWEGDLNFSNRQYGAYRFRRKYTAAEDEAAYIKSVSEKYEGLEIESATFENIENVYEEVKELYTVKVNDQVINAGDMLYFNPMLLWLTDENPFKLEERKYPVDFNFPREFIFSVQFQIPEGYIVEELPEMAVVTLPEKGGRFVYSVKQVGDFIQMTNQFKLSKHQFLWDSYPHLKEFYNLIVEKHGEQVVLKKKT